MSTGTSIPYHLRPNKAVERGLFIESLRKIAGAFNISEYQYIGFGGPFLEDFKSLHNELKIKDMICIEVDENVRKRQLFNRPLSCVNILEEPSSSTSFINEHNFEKESLVWFDFVSFNRIYEQLCDIRQLVSSLAAGDVFKVTLNANSSNLGKSDSEDNLLAYRLKKYRDLVTTEYEPHTLEEDDFASKNFPNILLQSFKRAVAAGIASAPELEVVPISAFVYEDGQKMLTATGVIVDRENKAKFFEDSRIQHWSYYSPNWHEAKNISLPSLSVRERLLVEQLLPDGNCDDVMDALGYFVGSGEADARRQMNNFIDYYRAFPWFGKVGL